MSDLLVGKVREAQSVDTGQDAMMYLLLQFRPLIRNYAWRLHFALAEDAEANLILRFIQIIHAVDLSRASLRQDDRLAAYIIKSMNNAYISLSKAAKKNSRCIPFSDCKREIGWDGGWYGESFSWIETKVAYEPSFDTNLIWEELLHVLTQHEAKIVQYHFSYGYGTKEIARIMGTSEPAVSKAKKKALHKLSDYILRQKEDETYNEHNQ